MKFLKLFFCPERQLKLITNSIHMETVSIKRKKKVVFICNRVLLGEQMDSNTEAGGMCIRVLCKKRQTLWLNEKGVFS